MTKRERVQEIIYRAQTVAADLERKRALGVSTFLDELHAAGVLAESAAELSAVISHVEHPGPVMELAPNDGTGTRLWIAGNRKEPTT